MKKHVIFILIILGGMYSIKAQVNFIWGKQIGVAQDDKARNLVNDNFGNIYIFGKTNGIIGEQSFGKEDGFIIKLDSTAKLIWKIQIGTPEKDDLLKGATDDLGNLYVTGYAGMSGNQLVNRDILVIKINNKGKIAWQKQFGTEANDIGSDIAVSSDGDIYVTGETEGTLADTSYGDKDCVILHLDNAGNQLDAIQFGTPAADGIYGMTIKNDSRIYVCGSTAGDLVKSNAGVGSTNGDLGAKQNGEGDSFIQKLSENGDIFWTKQFGTNKWDGTNGLDIINDDKILASGCLNYPNCRSFCRMYDADGNLLWSENHIVQGAGGGTCGKGICIDGKGNIYHTGYTGANMFSDLKGEHDIFVVKFKIDDNTK
ncbi:MAG: SBBP repeat-containing protein [Calditrichaceae bacterium]